MPATRRSTALSTVITVMAMLGMTGCQDQAPTDPTVTGIAIKRGGGGGKGPKVESTDPTQAPQETRLDVQVFGSSFDDGSSVTFTIDGTPSDLVRTNSTTFVSDKELTANITIDLTAIVDLYDVEVLSSRGRKGIGADLFSVTKKGKPGDDGPQFTITTTDLGTLEGSSSASASSVVSGPDGNSLRVVGESGGAFYWTPGGGMVELRFDPVASLKFRAANDLNDAANIVGSMRFAEDLDRKQALFWNSSTDLPIDLPAQGLRSSATAVNNNGQVAGWSFDHPDDLDAPHQHAMLWTVDGFGTVTTQDLLEDFVAAGGFVNSLAEGINDHGQIVGRANNLLAPGEQAFLWDDGDVTILGAGLHSWAMAINNIGQIVGGSRDQSGSQKALLWTVLADGTVLTEELPVLAGFESSLLTDVSDAGEVVGSSSPSNNLQESHATLWTFDPTTGARIVVDLGIGYATGIDNSASGLTRVVGVTKLEVGKGRKKTRNNHAVLWEVVPIIN